MPIRLPMRDRVSVVGLSLEIDVEVVFLPSISPRRVLRLEREEPDSVADGI